ncbi:n-acetylglutamate synthase [Spirosoma sp. 209]|uniref:n-acetylglutamate synthase n=1 Tax=Spirosoma sp. 209 TaxID=1955701 RepID=UPI00098D4476|nr:n-acetylglutamate synthase [Spirosoma sp. 209]
MINYHNRRFRSVSNSPTGEVSGETVFQYFQQDDLVWATYQGGSIRFGTLTGLVGPDGSLRFTYQHVNNQNELMTGHCKSTPDQLPDGRLRLSERWQWTSGTHAAGESVIEEIAD